MINVINATVIEDDEGVLVIPAGANITCTGCDMVTEECDVCECDLCEFLPYVDEEPTISSILSPLAIVGIVIGLIVTALTIIIITAVVVIALMVNRQNSIRFFNELNMVSPQTSFSQSNI
jgi:hypothetical protein